MFIVEYWNSITERTQTLFEGAEDECKNILNKELDKAIELEYDVVTVGDGTITFKGIGAHYGYTIKKEATKVRRKVVNE